MDSVLQVPGCFGLVEGYSIQLLQLEKKWIKCFRSSIRQYWVVHLRLMPSLTFTKSPSLFQWMCYSVRCSHPVLMPHHAEDRTLPFVLFKIQEVSISPVFMAIEILLDLKLCQLLSAIRVLKFYVVHSFSEGTHYMFLQVPAKDAEW